MSFTKAQDVSDMTALKTDITSLISARGTRSEARALTRYNAEKTTIEGRSTENVRRLGMGYIDRMISEGRDANALRHAQAIIDIMAFIP